MSFKLSCCFVLLVTTGVLYEPCIGRNLPFGFRFRDNNLLTCNVIRSSWNRRIVEEPRFRVPFQPARTGQFWQPMDSGYKRPHLEPLNIQALMKFLAEDPTFTGDDLSFLGTNAAGPPRDTAPLARTRLPGPFPTVKPPMLIFDELADQDEIDIVTGYVNSLGLGQCDLTASWVRLGGINSNNFFPFWYSASRCLNINNASSCSFPEGLSCEPDVSSPDLAAYITVLRWDCCYNYGMDFRPRFECGWRRVEIPIIVACTCACQPALK